MLKLPPTIRLARKNELPKNSDAIELLEKSTTANIVEGFTFQENTSQDLPFKFYAEINIDNLKFWQLFIALTNFFSEKISFIYNLFEEEIKYSPYLNKNFVLAELEKYKKELTQDCNFEFGLVFDSDELFEEVFVTDSKYFKIWGNDEKNFRNLMSEFGLNENQNLNFIDEFPKVVKPLINLDKSVFSTEILIEKFDTIFQINAEP